MSRTAALILGTAALALLATPAVAATSHWTIVNTIPPTVSGGQGVEFAGALAVDSTRGLVYVSSFYPGDDVDPSNPNPESSKIFLVDGAAGVITDTIDLSCVVDGCSDYLAGLSMATDPARDTLWVAYYGSGTVGYFTGGGLTNLTLVETVDVATSGAPGERNAMPFDLTVDPATGDVYVSDGDDMDRLVPAGSRIYVIDGATRAVTRYGDDGSLDPSYSGVALDLTTDTLYVPAQEFDYTATFDTSAGLVEEAAVQPDAAWGLNLGTTQPAVDSTEGLLFVTNVTTGSVGVYDTATGDPVDLIDLEGDQPNAVALDEGMHLLVVGTNTTDGRGRLWFIDTRTLAVIDRVDIPGVGVQSVGIDPVLGHVYAVGFVDSDTVLPESALFTLKNVPSLPNTGTAPDAGLLLAGGLAVALGVAAVALRRRMRGARSQG